MTLLTRRERCSTILLALVVALVSLGARPSWAAELGRLSGTVLNTEGDPLMGATVLVVGPLLESAKAAPSEVERIVTDTRGKFALERLLPGWYSLRVFSPTRLPAVRNRVQVKAGETSKQDFVLGDILAPLRIEASHIKLSTQGDDWKWILRTSSSTRPILRYRQADSESAKVLKPPLPAGQLLIGVVPGSARGEALGSDLGQGSVLAYFRPLSEGSDVLVAGSMTPAGLMGSSIATAFRRNLMKGDPQELTLTVHQLSFAEGAPLAGGDTQESVISAQGVVVSYTHTRRIADAMSLTAGFQVDYLTAAADAMMALPFAQVEYRLGPSSGLTLSYGAARTGEDGSLLERVGELNEFPRVTLRGYHPELERLNHAEARYTRRMGKAARVEVAAYHDAVQNAALWAFGDPRALGWLAGNFLPNPVSNGVTLNAGNFDSSGVRAAFSQNLAKSLETSVVYSFGGTLTLVDAEHDPAATSPAGLQQFLRRERTQAVGCKVSYRVPASRTKIVTSYEWLPGARVNAPDPVGQATYDIQPYLGVEIRQPLPTLAFFPAHIEAVADFRNLLAEGYLPLSRSNDERLLLTPAYRSFRGGFSVEF